MNDFLRNEDQADNLYGATVPPAIKSIAIKATSTNRKVVVDNKIHPSAISHQP